MYGNLPKGIKKESPSASWNNMFDCPRVFTSMREAMVSQFDPICWAIAPATLCSLRKKSNLKPHVLATTRLTLMQTVHVISYLHMFVPFKYHQYIHLFSVPRTHRLLHSGLRQNSTHQFNTLPPCWSHSGGTQMDTHCLSLSIPEQFETVAFHVIGDLTSILSSHFDVCCSMTTLVNLQIVSTMYPLVF